MCYTFDIKQWLGGSTWTSLAVNSGDFLIPGSGFLCLPSSFFGRRHTGHINQNSIWASPVAFNIWSWRSTRFQPHCSFLASHYTCQGVNRTLRCWLLMHLHRCGFLPMSFTIENFRTFWHLHWSKGQAPCPITSIKASLVLCNQQILLFSLTSSFWFCCLFLKLSGWTFDRLRNALHSGFRC